MIRLGPRWREGDARAELGRGSHDAELLEGEAALTVTPLAAYDLDRNVAG